MMKRAETILAILLAWALLSAPIAFAKDTKKLDGDSKKKATQTTEAKKQAMPRKLEGEKKEEPRPATTVVTPTEIPRDKDKSDLEIKPLEPLQVEPPNASAVDEKGRQIKWQIVCSGGNCGYNAKGFAIQDYLVLCGSVGQTAVGPGSSPSFGVNSGYWQEDLYSFLRGDANGDGVITITDAIYLLNYLFRDGPAPDPMAAGDTNCDDSIIIGDAIYLLNYLFRSGPAPSC